MQQPRWRRRAAMVAGVVVVIVVALLAVHGRGRKRSSSGAIGPIAQSQDSPPISAISSSDSAPSFDASTTTTAAIASNDKAALMPGEEEGDEDEAEDEANVMLPDPPGTLTTPGSLLFAPLLESRFENLLPGCTPATGDELQYMVENTTCAVITLQPGLTYLLSEFVRVTRRVSVIGRPLDMPTLDAHLTFRAFTVEPGGLLDLRFVRVYRGRPVRIIPQYYFEIRGGGVYVRAGGRAILTSCLFTVNPELITEFLISRSMSASVRLLGGYVLQEEGTLALTDCHFYVTRPGVLFREVHTIGGQVLVLGGHAVLTGCTFLSNVLFVNVIGVGDTVAVFGGSAIFTGCSFTFNSAFAASHGVGMLLFLGGGVAVLTGCSGASNIGAHTFFGAGGAIFTGGGVLILTGFSLNGVVALLAGAGIGLDIAHLGGVCIKTGVSQTGNVAINAIAFLGIAVYVGAGVVVHAETLWSRVAALTTFYGGGGSLYINAGVVTLIHSFGHIINIIASFSASGGHIALLAGWLTMVNCFFYKFEGIIAHFGQGTEILVLAGGAVLINTGYRGGAYALFISNPALVQIWIAGQVVNLANSTYHGALVTRERLDYFPSRKTSVRMLQVTFDDYDPTEVGRVFGLQDHHRRVRSLQTSLDTLFLPAALSNGTAATTAATTTTTFGGNNGGAEVGTRNDATTTAISSAGPTVSKPLEMMKLTWPGKKEFLIPPVPADATTDHVYLAGPLDECSLCDVKPGRTLENFDGAGLAGCSVADSCEGGLLQGKEGPSLAEQMWNPPKGMGLANTSVAILEIQTRYTPSSPTAARIDPASVKQAVEKASAALGLPQRFHLTVAPDLVNPLVLDDADYVASVLKDASDNGGLNGKEYGNSLIDEEGELLEALLREGARKLQYEECSVGKTFKVYVVSDWRNVTQAHVKGLRTQDAAQQLVMALQEAQTGSKTVQICEASVKAAGSLFVPGKKVSLLQDDADGQSKSPFGFGQENGLPSAVAELTDAASGDRVEDVEVGETYSLDLQQFPAATPLTVKLVPRDGLAVMTLGTFPSKPSEDAGMAQTWNWTVGESVKPGAYYLEVATPQVPSGGGALAGMMQMLDNSKLAFTQAFEVVG